MNPAMHDTGIVVKPRDVLPEGARTLPADYYVSADYFVRELDLLFRRKWICAGRTEEVAEPGQFVVRELPGDNIIVTRNTEGTVHAFHNVCRHRGTRLCTEQAGTFPGSIQCPYHAWTYGLDGRLLGAPHMDDVRRFRKEDYPLLRVHADEWDGHVFLNLSQAPAPLSAMMYISFFSSKPNDVMLKSVSNNLCCCQLPLTLISPQMKPVQ